MMPDHPALRNLRRAISRLKPRQRGDPRSVAMAQIEMITKQLDGADADTMAAFRAAFEDVFPEFSGDGLADPDDDDLTN